MSTKWRDISLCITLTLKCLKQHYVVVHHMIPESQHQGSSYPGALGMGMECDEENNFFFLVVKGGGWGLLGKGGGWGWGDVWVVCWQAPVLYHLCFQWAYARVLRGLPFQLPFFTPVCQALFKTHAPCMKGEVQIQ